MSESDEIYNIVKFHIDELDCEKLLANGAPNDEYDLEIKEIADNITRNSTVEMIAFIIAKVFGRTFGDYGAGIHRVQPDRFMDCAEKIKLDISKLNKN